jgi:hypothetical protein
MDDTYDDYLDGSDGDICPTPPNTPPPQEGGEPGSAEGNLRQVDEAYRTRRTTMPLPTTSSGRCHGTLSMSEIENQTNKNIIAETWFGAQ